VSTSEKNGGTAKSDRRTHDRGVTGLPETWELGTAMAGTARAGDHVPCDNTDSGRHQSSNLTQDSRDSKEGCKRGLMGRFCNAVHSRVVQPLVLSRNPPWFDARGKAPGLVVGFRVPRGGPTAALLALRLVMRFTFIVAIGLAAVVNPLSLVPLYYGYYCLGSFMLGRPTELNRELFEKIMHPILDKSHSWEALGAFCALRGAVPVRWGGSRSSCVCDTRHCRICAHRQDSAEKVQESGPRHELGLSGVYFAA
jgi:uncharacterized protein (DUF2062 family)